jgi:phage-related protein
MHHVVTYFNIGVRSAIEDWPVGILADFAHRVELLAEFGPALRMPHSRALGGGLFELRCHGPEGIGRVLYCHATGRRVVLLHGFIKKTRSTPARDVQVARSRMRKVGHD